MIISHKYKFIFIHINKCAGTSIALTLEPYLGDEDLLFGCTQKGEKLSKQSKKSGGLWKHDTAIHAKEIIDRNIWDSYFKFSFIRNPWDRVLSSYFWFRKCNWKPGTKGDKIKSLPGFSDYVKSKYLTQQSCSSFLMDKTDDKMMVDFVGKHESIDRDFAYVCGKIGLNLIELQKRNVTNHALYREYYDEETKKIVLKKYSDDIKLFNYQF